MPYDLAKAKLHLTDKNEVPHAVKIQSMKNLIKKAEQALETRGWRPTTTDLFDRVDWNIEFEVSDTIYVLCLEKPFGLQLDGKPLPLRYNTELKMFTAKYPVEDNEDDKGEIDGLVWLCHHIDKLRE